MKRQVVSRAGLTVGFSNGAQGFGDGRESRMLKCEKFFHAQDMPTETFTSSFFLWTLAC